MKKGWFVIPGVQDGDRSLADQLKGLAPALAEAAGRSVLDLGCAEGLIAGAMLAAGAASVHGVDCILPSVLEARRQAPQGRFVWADLNRPPADLFDDGYDIVLALAVLHKLADPAALAQRAAALARRLIVVRLPPATAPVIVDARSGNAPVDIAAVLAAQGFALERVERGHNDEWTGYFFRG